MRKRSFNWILAGLLLMIIGLAGYVISAPKDPLPQRILMKNSGGRVVFTHAAHMAYENMTCATCHHELEIPERELDAAGKQDPANIFSCKSCHGAGQDPEFIASHKQLFAKDDGGKTCLSCHHTDEALVEEHAASGKLDVKAIAELELTSCKSCHSIPGSMDAYHDRCMGCHTKVGKGPQTNAPCQQCHLP